MAVSLGSDAAIFWGVDVVDEYLTAHRMLGLAADEIAGIAHNSLHHSAAPERRPAATEGHWLRRHRRLAAQRGRQGKPFLLAPMTGQAAFAGGLLYRR